MNIVHAFLNLFHWRRRREFPRLPFAGTGPDFLEPLRLEPPFAVTLADGRRCWIRAPDVLLMLDTDRQGRPLPSGTRIGLRGGQEFVVLERIEDLLDKICPEP